MRQGPNLKYFAMVKSALVIAALVGGLTTMAANNSYADAKLVNAVNSSPIKDAVQVARGMPGDFVPAAWTEEEVPAVSPYAVVSAGNGWLFNQGTGRLISCYKIGTGMVGEREIRCVGITLR
jgi:hypothetical protein